jgi:hypothetical protein
MALIAEQAPDERKTGKNSDSNKQFTLPSEWELPVHVVSGDHPYRRRQL